MTAQINLRLDSDLMAEVEAWRNSIRPKPPLGAAARELIIEGLKVMKAQAEKPAREGKKR